MAAEQPVAYALKRAAEPPARDARRSHGDTKSLLGLTYFQIREIREIRGFFLFGCGSPAEA